MSISNYCENKIVDAVVNASTTGGGLPTADPWIKLHTGDPGEDCTSNAAGNTTRKQVSFGASSSGTATSNADASWTSVSTTETYTHISLWDANAAGNALWYGALTSSVAITAGQTFTIASGSLTVTVD